MPKALRLKVFFKGGPKYSGRTQPKWSVPFDLNRTAGILSLQVIPDITYGKEI